jgi:transposase
MNELELSAIYAEYERSDGRGLSAYHPLLMTRVLLYGYCIGITSSRRIEPDLKVPIESPSLSCIPPTSAPLASS